MRGELVLGRNLQIPCCNAHISDANNTMFIVIIYVLIVHHGVRSETNFVCLSHYRVTFDVDRDVSKDCLRVTICSMLVRRY